MNCSEFEGDLERLVEERGQDLGSAGAAHVVECEACREKWRDYRLLHGAVQAWRPVSAPATLTSSILAALHDFPAEVRARREPDRLQRPNPRGARWGVVVVAMACLVVVVGLGLSARNEPGRSNLAQRENRAGLPIDKGAPPVEVASSVAAVLDDLRSEYRVLAAETTATARELAVVLPSPVAPWKDSSLTDPIMKPISDKVDNRDTQPVQGGVTVIGRSFGSQIGQAMDFLWTAVPESVPRG